MPDTPAAPVASFTLDGRRPVELAAIEAVAARKQTLTIGGAARQRMRRACDHLDRMVEERRLIYGVTTGYGPLATEHVGPERARELQRNLIYHLATGVGPPLSPEQTRAVMAARLIALTRGHSAIRPRAVELLADCLEGDLLPLVPSMGTVGASGDLTPLAHVALGLMGEGEALLEGERMPAAEALARRGLEPLELQHKEGLALVNGTSAMTGIAALNGTGARRALDWALRLAVLNAELMQGRSEAWHPLVSSVRPHAGQQEVTARLQELIGGSDRLVPVPEERPRLGDLDAEALAHERPILQDPYTVRCVPQLFGAVLDVLERHDETVETELNAVTDNPLFFPDEEQVLHGGNFYGQPVAFVSDSLTNALVTLGAHAERVVARITDTKRNGDLPPFLQGESTGLQSGFMGAQVTATAVLAEMRSDGHPASTQTISTNAGNQDVVSMGTIAARKAARQLDHLYRILAIEALVLTQGYELRGGFDSGSGFCASSRALAAFIRERSDFLAEDRPLSSEIERLATDLARIGPQQ